MIDCDVHQNFASLFDAPTQAGIPAEWRQAVYHDNARAWYSRLPRAALAGV